MQEFLYLETLFSGLSLLILVRTGLDKKRNKLAIPLVGITMDCKSWMTLAGIADVAQHYVLCPIWSCPICFPCRPQSKSWRYCWLCFQLEEHHYVGKCSHDFDSLLLSWHYMKEEEVFSESCTFSVLWVTVPHLSFHFGQPWGNLIKQGYNSEVLRKLTGAGVWVWRMCGLVLCWTNKDPGGEGINNIFLETIGCTIIPFAGYYCVKAINFKTNCCLYWVLAFFVLLSFVCHIRCILSAAANISAHCSWSASVAVVFDNNKDSYKTK